MRRGSLFKLLEDCPSQSPRRTHLDAPITAPAAQTPPQAEPRSPQLPMALRHPSYSVQSGFFDQGESISLRVASDVSPPPELAHGQHYRAVASAQTYTPNESPLAFYVEPFEAQATAELPQGAAEQATSPEPGPGPQPPATKNGIANGTAAPTPSTTRQPAAQPADPIAVTPTEIVPSDDEAFEADLREILAGKKRYDANHRRVAPTDEPSASGGNGPAHASSPPAADSPPAEKNEHAIFERIAQSMQLAKAYDLGSVALNQRFDAFDQEVDQHEKKKTELAETLPPQNPDITTRDFLEDLDQISPPRSTTPAQPPTAPGVGPDRLVASPPASPNPTPIVETPVVEAPVAEDRAITPPTPPAAASSSNLTP